MQYKYIAAILAAATLQSVLAAPVPEAEAVDTVDNSVQARAEQLVDWPFTGADMNDLDRRDVETGIQRRAVQAAQAAQAAQAVQIQQAPQQNQAGQWGWPQIGFGNQLWANQLWNQRLLWNNNLNWRNQFFYRYPNVNWNVGLWQNAGLFNNGLWQQRWW